MKSRTGSRLSDPGAPSKHLPPPGDSWPTESLLIADAHAWRVNSSVRDIVSTGWPQSWPWLYSSHQGRGLGTTGYPAPLMTSIPLEKDWRTAQQHLVSSDLEPMTTARWEESWQWDFEHKGGVEGALGLGLWCLDLNPSPATNLMCDFWKSFSLSGHQCPPLSNEDIMFCLTSGS